MRYLSSVTLQSLDIDTGSVLRASRLAAARVHIGNTLGIQDDCKTNLFWRNQPSAYPLAARVFYSEIIMTSLICQFQLTMTSHRFRPGNDLNFVSSLRVVQ